MREALDRRSEPALVRPCAVWLPDTLGSVREALEPRVERAGSTTLRP